MESSGYKILLIEPLKERNTILTHILIELDFQVISVKNIETAVKKWLEYSPHIIICQKDLSENSGFHFFSMLENDLLKSGVPFILLMNMFNKEDLLVGMELGIDSFIFPPFDREKIGNIIYKQLQKSKERRTVAVNQFKSIFEVTPFGIFVARNKKIINANRSFYSLVGEPEDKKNQQVITNIFNFFADKSNELKLLRCLNGISRYCRFKGIPLHTNPASEFDIYLSFIENGMPSAMIIGLAIPLNKKVEDTEPAKKNAPENNNIVVEFSPPPRQPVAENDIFLTTREKQVLHLSAKGAPIKQIANQLGISVRTVEKHRSNIIHKTKSGNITEAVFYANNKRMIEMS